MAGVQDGGEDVRQDIEMSGMSPQQLAQHDA